MMGQPAFWNELKQNHIAFKAIFAYAYAAFCTPFTSIMVSPLSRSSLTVTNSYPWLCAVSISVGRYSLILNPLLWQRIIQPSWSFGRTVSSMVWALRSSFQWWRTPFFVAKIKRELYTDGNNITHCLIAKSVISSL